MMVIAALAFLILPRFFLVPIADTGIRTEDLLLLLLAPYAWTLLLESRLGMRRTLRGVGVHYGFVALAVAAAAIAGRMGLFVGLAFGLRPALYIAPFYVGYQLGLRDRQQSAGLLRIASAAILVHMAYGLAVALGIAPNVASFSAWRLAGLTNGPYELSAMACLVCVPLLWERRALMATFAFAAVMWTRSRIALAALPTYLVFSGLGRQTLVRWAVPILAVIAALVAIEARTSGSQLSETWEAISELREEFATSAKSRDDYFDAVYSEEGNANIKAVEGDASTLLRVARWSMVLATAVDSPDKLLIGMGPGYYSVALDGNYVRLIGESGVIGLVTFIWFMLQAPRSFHNRDLRRVAYGLLMQLLVIAIFIDVFASLKVMCLFWMFIGALKREEVDAAHATVA